MKNNDVQLIQRTLAGDETAFSTLVRKYQKPVHTLVWRKIGDFHIAEELTQDIFLRVYKKLHTLKNLNRFTGWLYVIATRRCFAWCKQKRIPMKSLDAMSTEELEELAYAQYYAKKQTEDSGEQQREVVAKSEATVELVDTFFVRASKQKPSVRNQSGNTDIPGKRGGNTNHSTKALQVVVDQSEQPDISDLNPLQAKTWRFLLFLIGTFLLQ